MNNLSIIPGPYRAEMRKRPGSTYGYWDISTDYEGTVPDTKLATVRLTTMRRTENLAKLFAAAPDLLDAVKALMPYAIGAPEWAFAERAVKKAEGR